MVYQNVVNKSHERSTHSSDRAEKEGKRKRNEFQTAIITIKNEEEKQLLIYGLSCTCEAIYWSSHEYHNGVK